MATTNFDTINGQIVSEHSGSTQLDYLSDALGSVIGVCDQTGSVVGTARYKPYGSTLASSGTQASVGWIGGPGYRPTGLKHSELYVRLRHDSDVDGRWTTVDPLWPALLPFAYANGNPTTLLDPLGLWPWIPSGSVWVPSDFIPGAAIKAAMLACAAAILRAIFKGTSAYEACVACLGDALGGAIGSAGGSAGGEIVGAASGAHIAGVPGAIVGGFGGAWLGGIAGTAVGIQSGRDIAAQICDSNNYGGYDKSQHDPGKWLPPIEGWGPCPRKTGTSPIIS